MKRGGNSNPGCPAAVPEGSEVTYVRVVGSVDNPLVPNVTLNGSDHYLINTKT